MKKITHTEIYKDSEGEHLVCRGKLVLIKTKEVNKKGDLCKFDYGYNIAGIDDIGYPVIKPIIISETEEIEVGDLRHDLEYKSIGTCINDEEKEIYNRSRDRYFKVLSLPEHFSPKHLQAIVDGKLKDGDEVLIQCYKDYFGCYIKDFAGAIRTEGRDNHIKLFPVKQSAAEAARDYCKRFDDSDIIAAIRSWYFIAGAKWAKNNNY